MTDPALEHDSADARSPRVALVSVGIGRIQRGYERLISDLFETLEPHADVTLYRWRGAAGPGERVPRLLPLLTPLCRLLPLGTVVDGAEFRHYKHDCLAYLLALLPTLWLGRIDVLHVIDFPLARALGRLRFLVPSRCRIVYCNACCCPPEYYPECDHIQHIAGPHYQEALGAGVAPERLTLIPCGVNADRFAGRDDREELRRRYAVAPSTLVVLVVSAVKRPFKRVDHIVDEFAKVEGDLLLWIDGAPEDEELIAEARLRLGDRCRVTHVPSGDVGDLYAIADVQAHAAVHEAFGLAIVEGLTTGLPVLTHDNEHFRWLVGADEHLVDMEQPGALAERLRRFRDDRALAARDPERARAVRERFDWAALVPKYDAMFRRAARAS